MKKLIIIVSLLLYSLPTFGSGSDTVFFKTLRDFRITDNLDEAITHPGLSDELENLDRPTYVVKIGWYNYLQVLMYTLHGYNVEVTLGDYAPLVFTWNTTLEAVTADGDDGIIIYVLSP